MADHRRESAAPARPVAATVEAVIIRADGTRVPLGTVSAWHASRWRRLVHRLVVQPATNARIRRANATVRSEP